MAAEREGVIGNIEKSGAKVFLGRFLRGFVIGGTMTVPGASGGTMAVILGIYDELLRAVSRFTDGWKRNLAFLAAVALGGAAGLAILSRAILWLLDAARFPTLYFFIGAIIGGLPFLLRKIGGKPDVKTVLCAALGFAAVFSLRFLPDGWLSAPRDGFSGGALMFAAGLVVAVALVLPGISASHMLLLFGVYDSALGAAARFDVLYLLPLALGTAVGVIASARVLERLMKRHPRASYSAILGFVAGALADVFPGLPSGEGWLWCALALVCGAAAIFAAGRLE